MNQSSVLLTKMLIPTKKTSEKPVFIDEISTLAMFVFNSHINLLNFWVKSVLVLFRVFLWKKGFVHVPDGVDSEHSPVQGRTHLEYAQDMARLCLRKHNASNVI